MYQTGPKYTETFIFFPALFNQLNQTKIQKFVTTIYTKPFPTLKETKQKSERALTLYGANKLSAHHQSSFQKHQQSQTSMATLQASSLFTYSSLSLSSITTHRCSHPYPRQNAQRNRHTSRTPSCLAAHRNLSPLSHFPGESLSPIGSC